MAHSDYICFSPFQTLHIGADSYDPCCRLWTTQNFGEPPEDPWKAFNNERAQDFRRSILDGSYKYCQNCAFMQDGTPNPDSGILHRDAIPTGWQRKIVNKGLTYIDPYSVPLFVGFNYDVSCNLQCPSCRSRRCMIQPGTSRHARLEKLQNKIKGRLLKAAEFGFMTGWGDPFASPLYSNLIRTLTPEEYPRLKWIFLTNGQLFSRRRYEELPIKRIQSIAVSIDAATPETYAINRIGGKWDRLMRNLAFLGELRAAGGTEWLSIRFLVQENNWREMKQFIELGARNNVDTVEFMAIRHLNTETSPEDYAQRAIWLPEHPRYNEFAKYLQDPVFHGDKVNMLFDLWKVKPTSL